METKGGSKPKSEDVIQDIRGKIERESKLIQGFQALKKNTVNTEVIQRCNTQIRETQSNMDYLEETMRKLSTRDTGTKVRAAPKAQRISQMKPVYTRFDLVKYDCPSLGHKIQYMLQQLQFKLQIENQYRVANEKIYRLYKLDGDTSSSNAAVSGRHESDQRIHLLSKALKRYQDMHVDMEDVTKDVEIMNTPQFARKPLTGKLFVSINSISDIDHIASPTFAKKLESIVCIKVDDVENARTRPSRSGRWNEEFQIDVDKSNEIEFTVYDKVGNLLLPVAVTWVLLSDVTEEIRKKKIANENQNDGWVSASNLPLDLGTKLASANESNVVGGDLHSSEPFRSDIPGSGAERRTGEHPSRVQSTTWLTLEPVGRVLLTLSFEKSNQPARKDFMGALGRHGAIRQKKEEVFNQHGHEFVQKQFYNIMCCAFCGEFLRYTGFQCQGCKFLCHKKCYEKVVTRCIAKLNNEQDSDEAKLNHKIPHRFEAVANHGTRWCCHCGYLLPWGRKSVKKCSECGVMCHVNCVPLVPDFCGMSMEMANQILTTIKTSKSNKSLPSQPKSSDDATVSGSPTKSLASQLKSSDEATISVSPTKTPLQLPSSQRPPRVGPAVPAPIPKDDPLKAELPTSRIQKPVQTAPKQVGRRPPMGERNIRLPPLPSEPQKIAERRPEVRPVVSPEKGFRYPEQRINQNNQADNFFATQNGQKIPEQKQLMPQQIDYNDFNYENSRTRIVPSDAQVGHARDKSLTGQEDIDKKDAVRNKTSRQKEKSRRRKIGLDDFQFIAVLGKGNFGKVMLAESRHTSEMCAIKVLKKDFIVENDEAESVKSEKRVFLTANREEHPFLLNLHCCFQTENHIYFVMEYISGGDLMWHIQKSRFSAKRAKFYACEVLLALKYLHENGIVYRDLKLDNILLTTSGHIKIADYGLCKENMYHKSTTGTFCGTPEFMAPEIIAGKPYERSVDWWAFGILLFQMLLCQSPFKGDDEDEIFNAIENDEVRYPISMPRFTVLVLQDLLTKDPTKRLGSSERDADEVMEHPYFQDVNFDDFLSRNVPVPYVPELSSRYDYSHFDKEFTSETPKLTPVETVLTSEMQKQFRGFSHISENACV